MRARCAFWIVLWSVASASGASASAEQLVGAWKRVSSNLSVRVEEWGENCGPAPKSYSNKAIVEMVIAAQGRHLIFSKGGLRTDRCSSANPKLVTKSEKISGTRWERVCETPADDPKFEHDEYVFVSNNNDEIEYVAKSSYNWVLNGDRCVLSLEERRVFTRDEGGAKDESAGAGSQAPGEEGSGGACERNGEVRRLHIAPRDAEVGPGERVCFKAFGTDEGGCRFGAEASWTAEQNGVTATGLMGRNGCFRAGATAAESEGTYTVTAEFEGKRASASVTVVFPDFGVLSRARLQPSQEPGGGGSAPAVAGAAGSSTAGAVASKEGGPSPLLVALVVVAFAAAGAVIVVVALRRRARGRRASSDSFDDLDDGDPGATALQKSGAGRYVPSEPPNGVGMVCPSCHRGYGSDARFCPHDSEKLLPYAEWRALHRRAK